MTATTGFAVFLMVWTYMLGPDGTPLGGDLTIHPVQTMAQCETLGRETENWLRGHFADGASWQCVEASPGGDGAQ